MTAGRCYFYSSIANLWEMTDRKLQKFGKIYDVDVGRRAAKG